MAIKKLSVKKVKKIKGGLFPKGTPQCSTTVPGSWGCSQEP